MPLKRERGYDAWGETEGVWLVLGGFRRWFHQIACGSELREVATLISCHNSLSLRNIEVLDYLNYSEDKK